MNSSGRAKGPYGRQGMRNRGEYGGGGGTGNRGSTMDSSRSVRGTFERPVPQSRRGGFGRDNQGEVPHNFRHEGSTQSGRRTGYPIRFSELMKLAEEATEPPLIVQRFGESDFGLKQLIEENATNWDILEMILVTIGNFCRKNGPTLFSESFIGMVRILIETKVFSQITSIILQIPNSRSNNLPPKPDRFKRLLESVNCLTIEVLVMMPALACNTLGENFYMDIKSLENFPSLKALKADFSFEIFDEGVIRLKKAWEQQAMVNETQKPGRFERPDRAALNQLRGMELPPDDFRQLSVTPTWEDVCIDTEPFIRPNIVRGSYPDVDSYLDIQFRLLREDFFNPLRAGLVGYKRQLRGHKNKQPLRIENVRFYHGVKISDCEANERGPTLNSKQYVLQFTTKGLERIQWEASKRLLNGSLLCLSSDNFTSILLFTISERQPHQLSKGQVVATLEGSNSLSAKSKRDVYVMAESSVYFEAYRSILSTLQTISPNNFPMKDYILGQSSVMELPGYLQLQDEYYHKYDLTSILSSVEEDAPNNSLAMKRSLLLEVSISNPHRRPGPTYLGLDPSQTEALYAALTQKLAIIQGPPGTGKTFLGLKIVEVLLRNKKFWKTDLRRDGVLKPSPILVICYTNHALDQFLEGIAKFTKDIVRLGGRSKCEAMEMFSLRQWKKSKCNHEYRRLFYKVRDEVFELKSTLEARKGVLRCIEAFGIVHESSLFTSKVIPKIMHDKLKQCGATFRQLKTPSGSIIPYWLGFRDINDEQELPRILEEIKKAQQLTGKTPNADRTTTKEDEPLQDDDDQWDKEDIDQILEERSMEDNDNILMKRAKTIINKHEQSSNITFGLKSSELTNANKEWEKILTEEQDLDTEERLLLNQKMNHNRQQLNCLTDLLKIVPPFDIEPELSLNRYYGQNLFQIPYDLRWRMYITWIRKLVEDLEKDVTVLEHDYRILLKQLKDVEILESSEVCHQAAIIGVTTTGAAKQRALLGHLRPKIVIVEEAAEVLEAHIITSLSASCEHLILIGDHQQLRPPTTVYRLAKDFNLDVSLFERLIQNGMKPCILSLQHRMRPEVARLIVPSIYPKLENHRSVLEYPNILGMEKNVFFLKHDQKEKEDRDGKSHLNPHEADMTLALVRHLLMQGYDPSQITVLTTYSGQLLHFKKIRRNQFILQPVRISIVDSFQGEENDIIILSLVRSNAEENIGFLRIENRICVALSRAKKGFYLIGNMDILQGKSKLWKQISETLSLHGQLGPAFGLKCEIHNIITKAVDVSSFPPEGGCFLKCLSSMPCGHICPKLCHLSDREHLQQHCYEDCTRSCTTGHPCVKKCFEDCHPCMEPVYKNLPCSHNQITECFKDPKEVYCTTKVWKDFPKCQHSIEIDCSAPVGKIKCRDICGMILECSHECDLSCHNQSSHDELPCRQSCLLSPCPEKHPCPKECFESCGDCKTQVLKKLPCGHDATVECYVLPKDVYCTQKVEKNLPNCDHVVNFECSESTANYECRRVCLKTLCGDGHRCQKLCFKPCGRCEVNVKRTLSCGHENAMRCYTDPLAFKCKFPKEAKLPGCNHNVTITCGDRPEDVPCPHRCDVRLDCGHVCTRNCHMKDDPEHENYRCKKRCEKKKIGCKNNHKCSNPCYEDCEPCKIKCKRALPCGHEVIVECNLNDEDIFCEKIVSKTISECGHQFSGPCSVVPTREDCKESCKKMLTCGHRCSKDCKDICDASQCVGLVRLENLTGFCNHQLILPCQKYSSLREVFYKAQVADSLKEECLVFCTQPCAFTLKPCGHQCKGTCGECFSGRLHEACQEKCGRPLVCGHLCDVNCASTCPPCKKKCEYRCRHSKCAKECSEPCAPCMESCGWRCEHYKCSRKCWEQCDRPRCDEPCKKKLSCGHDCVGLCGEPCPPLCRVCHTSQLTELFLGNEEDEDAKFVYLPDCGHCIEVEGLDYWMDLKDDEKKEIQMKCCPRCKTIIRDCSRYGNVIKSNMLDIVAVKKRILGSPGNATEFALAHHAKIQKAISVYNRFKSKFSHSISDLILKYLADIETRLTPFLVKKKRVDKSIDPDQQFALEVQLDVVERVLEVIEKSLVGSQTKYGSNAPMKTELFQVILSKASRVLKSAFQRQRFSEEEYNNFVAEMERLSLIRAFFLLRSVPNYENNAAIGNEKKKIEKLLLHTVAKIDSSTKTEIQNILKVIGSRLSMGLGIDDVERQQILKAMGMTKGHWFKCPNGHIYAIGECGGAMEESICNECKARIGGGSHNLRADNALAREMDGATYAAWSETANNMGNFRF